LKSDNWLTEKIVKESLNKQDISYVRKLIQEGMSDEEILLRLRKKIFSNSKGMRAYIRQEKNRALMLKLSYRIHWVYILPIIKRWLREKEALVRWKESKHYSKIEEKAKELKRELVDTRYNKVRCDCINTGDIPKDVMKMFERAAEELLLQIEVEEEEVDGSLNSKESLDFINTQIKTKHSNLFRKDKSQTAVPGGISLSH
jgi:hypothetical protein